MESIKLLEYKEGNFLLKEIPETEKLESIHLSINPVIYWSEKKEDFIAFRIESIIWNKDSEVLRYDSTQMYQVDGLHKQVRFQQGKIELSSFAMNMAYMAIGFYRGAFTARLRETKLSNIYFPVLDAGEFLTNSKIVKLAD